MIRTLASRALVFCLSLLPLASMLKAQELPALYAVAGVAADDTLNVRSAPSASAEVIGTLAPDAKDIEVVGAQAGWGLLNIGERSGWASLRYLEVAPEQPFHGYPHMCFGTEPYWSLTNAEEMKFELLAEDQFVVSRSAEPAASWQMGKHLLVGSNGTHEITTIIARASCNDGMSDREFGLSADVLVRSPEGYRLFSGCCTLR